MVTSKYHLLLLAILCAVLGQAIYARAQSTDSADSADRTLPSLSTIYLISFSEIINDLIQAPYSLHT